MSERERYRSTIVREKSEDGTWKAWEPDSSLEVYGRGRTQEEAVANYARAMETGDRVVATREVQSDE